MLEGHFHRPMDNQGSGGPGHDRSRQHKYAKMKSRQFTPIPISDLVPRLLGCMDALDGRECRANISNQVQVYQHTNLRTPFAQ